MTDDIYFYVIAGLVTVIIIGTLGLIELFFNDGDHK